MRKTINSLINFWYAVIDFLAELNRRTDLYPFIMEHTSLVEWDDYDEEEEEPLYLGVVTLVLAPAIIFAFIAGVSCLFILL